MLPTSVNDDQAWPCLVARRLVGAFVDNDEGMVAMISAAIRSDVDLTTAVPLALCALLVNGVGGEEEVARLLRADALFDFNTGV